MNKRLKKHNPENGKYRAKHTNTGEIQQIKQSIQKTTTITIIISRLFFFFQYKILSWY